MSLAADRASGVPVEANELIGCRYVSDAPREAAHGNLVRSTWNTCGKAIAIRHAQCERHVLRSRIGRAFTATDKRNALATATDGSSAKPWLRGRYPDPSPDVKRMFHVKHYRLPVATSIPSSAQSAVSALAWLMRACAAYAQ